MPPQQMKPAVPIKLRNANGSGVVVWKSVKTLLWWISYQPPPFWDVISSKGTTYSLILAVAPSAANSFPTCKVNCYSDKCTSVPSCWTMNTLRRYLNKTETSESELDMPTDYHPS